MGEAGVKKADVNLVLKIRNYFPTNKALNNNTNNHP